MTFVDLVTITIYSGKGGPGASSFRREKFVPKGGPDGGNGGTGGCVIFQANSNLQTLMDLKIRKKIKAQNGQSGEGGKRFGRDGKNEIIQVPCGTIIREIDGDIIGDLTSHGMTCIAAEGGKGGKGNACFANSTHQTPTYAQPGIPGTEKNIELELQLLAEVGIIGLPNAGKSTLLKTLTSANPKIGSYPFTTLFPNLGMLKHHDREILLADIPGLIEGASKGIGLGHEFLRHLSRTTVLVHLIEIPLENPEESITNYHKINSELIEYDDKLSEKKQLIVLSKADLIPKDKYEKIKLQFKQIDKTLLLISSHSRIGLDELSQAILNELTEISE